MSMKPGEMMFAMAPYDGIELCHNGECTTFELLEFPELTRPYFADEARSAEMSGYLSGHTAVLWAKTPRGTKLGIDDVVQIRVFFQGGTLEFRAMCSLESAHERRWGLDGESLSVLVGEPADIWWTSAACD